MWGISNTWNKLVNIGVSKGLSPSQSQRIRLINITTLVIMIVCGLLIISTSLQGRWAPMAIQIYRVVLGLIVLIIQSRRRWRVAMFVMYFGLLLSLMMFMFFVEEHTSNSLSYFVMFIFVFYYARSEKRAALYYWVTAVFFIFSYYYELTYKINKNPNNHFISLIAITTAFYFMLRLYRKDQRKTEKELKGSNEVITTQKRDLQQRGEEIAQQNEELRQQTDYLENLNNKLKKTQEILSKALIKEQQSKKAIEDAHKELKTAQEHLINAEKMATLGQVVANVAHELNTPLAAINTNVEYISQNLDYVISSLPAVVNTLSDAQKRLFEQFVGNANSQKQDQGTAKEQRKKRKDIEAFLLAKGINNYKIIARRLVTMGYSKELLTPYLPLIENDTGKDVMSAATQLTSLVRGTEIIKLAIERSTKVIYALRSYSHSEHGQQKSGYDVKEGLEMALIIHQGQIKRGIDVKKDYDHCPNIIGYPDELGQVWTNLIHNAIQAMGSDGTLTIKIKQLGDEVLIEVRDSGLGMSKEVQEKIFQPYFTTKPVGEGSGLGLNIVRRIIEKHEGRIEIESELGVGTAFKIFLPINSAVNEKNTHES